MLSQRLFTLATAQELANVASIDRKHVEVEPGVSNMVGNDNMDAYDDKLASEAVDSLQLQIKDFGDLEKEEWYHGCLPFEDIVGLLKNDGDFLIRELEPEGDRQAM
ncbi:hypothetical protein OSTOST_00678, partial [Ostertagia ostertagi]